MSLQTQHQSTHALGKFYFCPYNQRKEKGKGMKIQLGEGAIALKLYVLSFFYLQCWCCCCIYFAGYQHDLVSMLCALLHPESKKKRERERKKKNKRKKKNEKMEGGEKGSSNI